MFASSNLRLPKSHCVLSWSALLSETGLGPPKAIFEESLGELQPEAAANLSGLAALYESLGDFEQAMETIKERSGCQIPEETPM